MTWRTKIIALFIYAPLVVLAVLWASAGNDPVRSGREPADPEEIRSFERIRDMILDRYVEPIDSEELIFHAIQGMIEPLDHARFYIPEEEAAFQEEISGAYVGIGCYCTRRGDGLFVYKVLPGSPAARVLDEEDEVLEIEGESTKNMTHRQAYALMRGDGKVGSTCTLKIRKAVDGRIEVHTLTRERIQKPSVFGGWVLDQEQAIGYILISQFLQNTGKELADLVERLKAKGIRSLILDLRGNTGGVLDSALVAANLFIPEGVLVTTRGRQVISERVYTANRSHFAYPDLALVVLINGQSASAAEVLAGALQDYKRAVLLGTHSFGKGVVQSATKMELFGRPVVVKLPVALYFLPSGRCIEKELGLEGVRGGGLEPDILVPVDEEAQDRIRRSLAEISLIHDPAAGLETEALDPALDPQFDAAIRLLKGEKIFTPLPGLEDNE
jgi:carboxyl-terminal processing protease